MNEENVKQHVVQAAYLALFNYDNKYAHFKPRNRKINVTLKDKGKTFPKTIGDVACEKHYMTIVQADSTHTKQVDEDLTVIENNDFRYIKNLNEILSKPWRANTQFALEDEIIIRVSEYIAMTFLRAQPVRSHCTNVVNKKSEYSISYNVGNEVKRWMMPLGGYGVTRNDNLPKMLHAQLYYSHIRPMTEFLSNSIIVFDRTDNIRNKFITSDNPVIKLGGIDGYGLYGLQELAFPISPFCSIRYCNPMYFDYSQHLIINDVDESVVEFYNAKQKQDCMIATYSYYA